MAKKCGKTPEGAQKYYYEKTGKKSGRKFMVCQVPAKGDIPIKGYDPAKHSQGSSGGGPGTTKQAYKYVDGKKVKVILKNVGGTWMQI